MKFKSTFLDTNVPDLTPYLAVRTRVIVEPRQPVVRIEWDGKLANPAFVDWVEAAINIGIGAALEKTPLKPFKQYREFFGHAHPVHSLGKKEQVERRMITHSKDLIKIHGAEELKAIFENGLLIASDILGVPFTELPSRDAERGPSGTTSQPLSSRT